MRRDAGRASRALTVSGRGPADSVPSSRGDLAEDGGQASRAPNAREGIAGSCCDAGTRDDCPVRLRRKVQRDGTRGKAGQGRERVRELHNTSHRFDRIYYYSYGAPSREEQEEGERKTPKKLPFDRGLAGRAREARPAYDRAISSRPLRPTPEVEATAIESEARFAAFRPKNRWHCTAGSTLPGSPTSYTVEFGTTGAFGSETHAHPAGRLSAFSEVSEHVKVHVLAHNSSGDEHWRLVVHSGGAAFPSPPGEVDWGRAGE